MPALQAVIRQLEVGELHIRSLSVDEMHIGGQRWLPPGDTPSS